MKTYETMGLLWPETVRTIVNKDIIIKIFRGLWKFVFRSEDEKTKDNREINLRAIKIIFDKERMLIIESIKQEVKYYSHISTDANTIKRLIEFISLEKEIYESLDDSAKEIIKPILNEHLSYFSIAFFISESPIKHIQNLTDLIADHYYQEYGCSGKFIKQNYRKKIQSVCSEFGLDAEYRKLGITCFICSTDFDAADMYFDIFIEPYLDSFTAEEFEFLLRGINRNSQCYYRKRSRNGNDSVAILKAAQKKLDSNYDFYQFSNLPIEKL